jgi:hypothetical protein
MGRAGRQEKLRPQEKCFAWNLSGVGLDHEKCIQRVGFLNSSAVIGTHFAYLPGTLGSGL